MECYKNSDKEITMLAESNDDVGFLKTLYAILPEKDGLKYSLSVGPKEDDAMLIVKENEISA